MGTEAGQSLDVILRRKELERQAGDGVFSWGIGNALGTTVDLAREQSPTGEVDVLFTPMKSAPKLIDTAPAKLLLWLGYEANGAIIDLPAHMFITSRGGEGKRGHYALLCHSDRDLTIESDEGVLDAACMKNLKTGNALAPSQVTSVVKHERDPAITYANTYKIAFRAKLHDAGYVRLAKAVEVTADMMAIYEEVCSATSTVGWLTGIAQIRREANKRL